MQIIIKKIWLIVAVIVWTLIIFGVFYVVHQRIHPIDQSIEEMQRNLDELDNSTNNLVKQLEDLAIQLDIDIDQLRQAIDQLTITEIREKGALNAINSGVEEDNGL